MYPRPCRDCGQMIEFEAQDVKPTGKRPYHRRYHPIDADTGQAHRCRNRARRHDIPGQKFLFPGFERCG